MSGKLPFAYPASAEMGTDLSGNIKIIQGEGWVPLSLLTVNYLIFTSTVTPLLSPTWNCQVILNMICFHVLFL